VPRADRHQGEYVPAAEARLGWLTGFTGSAGAAIVLSGLLPSHANAVLAIYRAQGLALERRIAREGWVTLVMRRGCPPRPAR